MYFVVNNQHSNMKIKIKKGVDRAAVGAAQKRLDRAREFAAKEMQPLSLSLRRTATC